MTLIPVGAGEPVSDLGPLRPLRLAPVFVERIWGACSLEPWFKGTPAGVPIGEVWLTANQCTFADGALRGRVLAAVWRAMRDEWAGSRSDTSADFPLLVKFLFPEQKLSVQVHPSDDDARRQEGSSRAGKTEMWYAVEARAGAEVFVGLKPGVTAALLRQRIQQGTVEDCLTRLKIRAGDAIFVPAGTAHTIGPGAVWCEIQQNSDLTYRLFDYNRHHADGSARELHIEKALAVINFGQQGGGRIAPARVRAQGAEIAHFIGCRYFAAQRWNFAAPIALSTEPEHFELWIVCAGTGRIAWGPELAREGFESYVPGQAFFIPAALRLWRVEPQMQTSMLRVWVPDLQVYAEQLKSLGVARQKIAAVVRA